MAKMYAGSNAALTMGYIIAAHMVGADDIGKRFHMSLAACCGISSRADVQRLCPVLEQVQHV